MQTSLTYDVWSTKYVYIRFEYGVIELMTELGGLFEILRIFGFGMSILFMSDPKLFVLSELIRPAMKTEM